MSSLLLRFPQDGAWDPDKKYKEGFGLKFYQESEQASWTGLQTGRFESF